MKSNKRLSCILSLVAVIVSSGFFPTHADSFGTAFTYQGRLVTSTGPASGTYELTFSLWDASTLGNQIGPNQGPYSVNVTGGVFSVQLDFGSVFQGDLRYLEIAARTNNPGAGYTVLPRQPLTPAPNAIFAAHANDLPGLAVITGTSLVTTQAWDQSNEESDTGFYLLNNGSVWQSFRAGFSGQLVLAFLMDSGSAILNIYAGEGTNGTKLFTSASPVIAIPGGEFITTPVSVTAGSTYTFELRVVSTYAWLDASANDNAYPNGHCRTNGVPYNGDLVFDTWVSSSYTTNYYQTSFGQQANSSAALTINGTVTASKFVGTMAASQLSGTISSNNIGAGSITAVMLAAGAVSSNQLADDAVTPDKLQSNRSSFSKVSGGTLSIDGTGNVGISTINPQQTLDVNGWATIAGNLGIGTTQPQWKLQVDSGDLMVRGTNNYASQTRATIFLGDPNAYIAAQSGYGLVFGAYASPDAMILQQISGNVGIGTTSPRTKLDVNGTVTATAFVGNAVGLTNISLLQVSGDVLSVNSGNVGIWTTTPQKRLQVDSGDVLVRGPNNYAGTGNRATLFMGDTNAYIAAQYGAGLRLGAYQIPDALVLQEVTGNVGIGTNSPGCKLDVAGEAAVDVLTIRGGSDLAEPFNIADSNDLKPGMVVCIDPEKPGTLCISTRAYDHAVAGIISGAGGVKTGLVLKQENSIANGIHPVALSGRVYCYADADANGAIQPGDLLTTSATPGHAMKATDMARRSGAVIGKAMSRLDRGKGLVLVLERV